ncbi:MAG: H-X9-DG-CTERM domain-containing protein, partial [Alphaproteobacteria bacterium]
MPVEIKELPIKVTVRAPEGAAADLFLFAAAPPGEGGGKDAPWFGGDVPYVVAPDPGPVDAAPAVRHTGGVNVAWGDG